DEVSKISTSVYVTNIPNQVNAKDLWNACKQYENVVDSFIPDRRSKLGKRFGFVRFIKIFDVKRLVKNLCTVWIGRHKIHANVARVNGHSNSYAHVVKKRPQPVEVDVENAPASLVQASKEFITEGRVIWVEIEGVPIKMWSQNTFYRIAAKWGVLLNDNDEGSDLDDDIIEGVCKGDDGGSLVLEGGNDVEEVPETKYEEEPHNSNLEEVFVGKKDSRLEDSFNIYDLLNKKQKDSNKSPSVDDSLKYPPGFTTTGVTQESAKKDDKSNKEEGECFHSIHVEEKEDVAESFCSCHFKKSEAPRTCGSILQLIEDLVKVGHTMGCNMDVASKTWKRGVWVPSVISNWKDEVVTMGDFNEVRTKDERLKYLKEKLRAWNNDTKRNSSNSKIVFNEELAKLDATIDKAAQKAKIKWAIEGDENSKYYHDILNKKRNQLTIRGILVEGGNSSFVALISKKSDANMVKDFRLISLIGSLYKIIAKTLANCLVTFLGDIVNEVQSAFVADRQIIDGPFILNELVQWWRSSISFFVHFGDRESSYFVPKSCGCRLRINMNKSKFMGVVVDDAKVEQAALNIGCVTLKVPFSYLGSKVGGSMSRIQSWNEIIDRVTARLSKWQMKTLSIGGRLTLIKLVLGMKPIWVKWKSVLSSKKKGGLGVSSVYALNRALMFKWIWQFFTQGSFLWARVIKAIHEAEGKIGKNVKPVYSSIWLDIIREVDKVKKHGIDLVSYIYKKLGNGANTSFWEEIWREDVEFKKLYPRLYALEAIKNMAVASKLSQTNLVSSFHRVPRGGVEQSQLDAMMDKLEGVLVVNMRDRWVWSLEGSEEFSVASVRKLIDDKTLSEISSKSRWIKVVPIKSVVESSRHTFFTCHIAKDIFRKVCRWWGVYFTEVSNYEEWLDWILNIRFSVKYKNLLEVMPFKAWVGPIITEVGPNEAV
nr:RNA-directed DNA polymerase, eukaryota, reverse transcriptase zinc-binding domain protein [Tanacetum cinerariifolium]